MRFSQLSRLFHRAAKPARAARPGIQADGLMVGIPKFDVHTAHLCAETFRARANVTKTVYDGMSEFLRVGLHGGPEPELDAWELLDAKAAESEDSEHFVHECEAMALALVAPSGWAEVTADARSKGHPVIVSVLDVVVGIFEQDRPRPGPGERLRGHFALLGDWVYGCALGVRVADLARANELAREADATFLRLSRWKE